MESDLVGRRLGPFEIVQYNGNDGLAECFQGYDPRIDQPVVIKIVGRDLAADPVFNARFRREAKGIASLRHPNIAELIDFGQAEGGHYTISEYVDGLSLTDLIEQVRSGERALEPDDITFWMRQVAAALDHAHRHGVTHGSVAPQYIILTRSGQAIVTDFGVGLLNSRAAAVVDEAMILPATPYMAPEQIADFRAASPASDIYALGVILYQLVTGELPYNTSEDVEVDDVLRHLNETAPDPRFLNPDVPPAVAMVILKALAQAPSERFRNAMRLAEALERAYAHPNAGEEILEGPVKKPKPAEEAPRPKRARPPKAEPPVVKRRPPTAEERREKKRIQAELDAIKKAEEDEKRRIRNQQRAIRRRAFLAKWGRTLLVMTIVLLLLVAVVAVLQTIGVIQIAVKLPSIGLPKIGLFGPPATEGAEVATEAPTDTPVPTDTPTPYPTPTIRPTATSLVAAQASPVPAMEFVPLQAGSMAFRMQDGEVMVYVPSGAFLMGTNAADRSENSRPQHTVTLAAYWIDRTEITNAQYRLCVEEGFCNPPANRMYFDNPSYDNYPVTQVAYDAAAVYCLYIGTKTQQIIGLPTEAQWEKAAGWDPATGTQRTFPWGDEAPTPDRMRYVESNITHPQAPVGSYPAGASAYGAYDMAGNVWEWVADWFDTDYYKRTGISLDPLGPESGLYRVTRGGSWTREAHLAVTTVRNPVRPTIFSNEIGFRCAMNVDRPPAGSGIAMTPIELVQAYDTLIEQARGAAGNDSATLDEWVAALDELETVLLGVDHMRASVLINDRLDHLETQANNGLIDPVLAQRLELGLLWIREQVTAPPPIQVATPAASPTP